MRKLLLGACLVGLVACSAGDNERRFASLGTAGTGGIYYPLGGALARMISETVPGLQVTAEVTGGSVENINRLVSGEMDLGLAIGTTLVRAAVEDPDRYADLRVVAPLYSNVAHILVSRGTALLSLAGAQGMRISIGAPGSGTEEMARELLRSHGLQLTDYRPHYLSFAESAAALSDNAIDLAIFSVGYPAAAVLEASTTGGVRLIGLEPEPLARLLQEYPYYSASAIPAGSYPGTDQAITTASVLNWVVARADLDPAVVSAVLDALRDRRDELAAINEVARQIELGDLGRSPLPLHDAAAEWLRTSRPATR